MGLDFTKLPLPKVAKAQVDPFKIFAALPRLAGSPNDLWRGQAEALSTWHINRERSDVLVSLNTGAGKTLVGILIAKSFCNEGLENVIYVCPTNDLVKQTAAQARSWGINVTTRIDSKYDNDLFETRKAFCITSYSSVFNGLSSIRRKHFPDAIIFDDAHVAEAMMRDSYTLTIRKDRHPALFNELATLYLPHFRELGREGEFLDSLDSNRPSPGSALVSPDIVASTSAQLGATLRLFKADSDDVLKYSYPHLRDHLGVCAIIFRAGVVEITPPFLPSLTLDVFDRRLRRVYLSATLHNKADIVRAFGRSPDVLIEPANDAGNGERLIVFERELKNSDKIDAVFARALQARHKVLVAIPGYFKAKVWETLASPPKKEDFSERLDEFRRARSGSFILVSRVDGIDLPHDTCRLMIIDGIPKSEGVLERYQFEFLNMRTFAASRIANRLVQLFGRINRGRSDYGAFLITGHDLNVWMANDKHVALLPELLKKQILLGRHIQSEMNISRLTDVSDLLDKVLLSTPRDRGWLEFYSQFIDAYDVDEDKSRRALLNEERNLEAAKAEAQYAKAVWDRDFGTARSALDAIVADTARSDEKLAGWHNLWIGAAFFQEGDPDTGRFYYAQARGQLGLNLAVSTGPIGLGRAHVPAAKQGVIGQLTLLTSLGRESFEKRFRSIERNLAALDGGSASQVEEAVRYLGEMLGFLSSRPDSDYGTGPDVLWRDDSSNLMLGIELKTDKQERSEYTKHEVAQSLDHLSWMNENREGMGIAGTVLVGPDAGYSHHANPTEDIYSAKLSTFAALRDKVLAIARDAYKQLPIERVAFIDRSVNDLSFVEVSGQLMAKRLKQ